MMRWDRSVGRGMQTIYSLATVELEAGQLSGLECQAAQTENQEEDREGEYLPGDCGGQCPGCRAAADMAKALSYLGQIIHRHKLGTDED